MFNFMKSKKGFSLVELMIVVVIMAILVAVAVPIYNAVTANARKKTCLDNQRTIINTVSNQILLKGLTPASGAKAIITTNNTGDGATLTCTGDTGSVLEGIINSNFQTLPYCPTEPATEGGDGITVTVTVTLPQGSDIYDVTTVCSAGHALGA